MKQNDLYFIDNRNVPQYPLVTGNLELYCSFNSNDTERCSGPPPSLSSTSFERQPNILFLLIESFSPSPQFVNPEIALPENRGKQYLENISFYDDNVMPNLNRLAKNGIVMPQTSSVGAPTVSGFIGLLSSEKPKLYGINSFSSRNNQKESFTRVLAKQLGYYTTITLPAPMKFDQQQPWISDEDRFDEIHWYYPDEYHRRLLGIEDTK